MRDGHNEARSASDEALEHFSELAGSLATELKQADADKAELVQALKDLADLYDGRLEGPIDANRFIQAFEKARAIVAKHGGQP